MTDDEDPPLFDLDPRTHARAGDPDTSHEAARRLSDHSTMIRRLLDTFARHPAGLTAEEVSAFAGFTPDEGPWKRVSDLVDLGLVEDTDRRRIATSNRPQVVRRITDAGREALRA